VTTPALEFNDPKVARDNLQQLKARPTVLAGAIYGADGALFASYAAAGAEQVRLPASPLAEGHSIVGDRITVYRAIRRNQDIIGTVYLTGQYPLGERVFRYATILTLVMLASLGVATLVSLWLNAVVTRPIEAVTDAVHQVIRRRDFSLRVEKTTDDEIGVLVDAFNGMLSEVGERSRALEATNAALQEAMNERLEADEALRELNNTLEQRIAARTDELERAHEQLRHSQKMEAIGQLTGGVAHDFNNVLQVISGNLQLLQIGLEGDERARKRLETAAFAADRGAKLSSQLLAFARRQPLQPVPTNLGRVLRGMDDMLRRALGEAIEIRAVVAPGLWNTMIDPNQIENVILNLSINARDAMKTGGSLTLELCNAIIGADAAGGDLPGSEPDPAADPELGSGEYVLLGITDTGSGMPPEIMARAFEPFFTTKKEGEGTGLGLSMAYGFVKQSHGHIKIDSRVGQGTSIRIYLPRAAEEEVALRPRSLAPVAGGSETILVVEDDPAVQATVVDMLTGLGYDVVMARDGASALDILAGGAAVDLLFTDVVMPGPLRSPELARQARSLLPQLQVLFTSGYTQDAIVHGGRLDAGVELLSKPYRREDLARRIRDLLGPPRPPPAALAPVAAPGPTAVPSALRILVVEDNTDARDMVCELLMLMGHDVQGCETGEAAVAVLADARFDVLLTDVSLPGMSGIDLARLVVRKTPGTRIIFSSGHGRIDPAALGFDALSLPKPYDLDQLGDMLAGVCPA
jgi:signal transduction histidine kinase/DNA-binding response OmpR family regulator